MSTLARNLCWCAAVLPVLAVSCQQYPSSEPPPNALPREVTAQLDKEVAPPPKIALTVRAPEGQRDIPMAVGPERVLTFADGVRITFGESVTVKGMTFEEGAELVKVDGWWCRCGKDESP